MRKKLIVLQENFKDCGSASLLSILRYYGGNAPLSKIIEMTNTTKEGSSFYGIKEAAYKLGLSAKAYYLNSLDYFLKLNSPSICQIQVNNMLHFIVVYKKLDNKFEIMDPAVGGKYMVIDEFQKRWTGYIMIFEPYSKLINYKEEKVINNIILQIIYKNKNLYLAVFFMSIIYTIASCVYSYYMKVTIDKVINSSINNLIIITLIFAVVAIIKNISNFFRNYILIYINEKMDFSLLNKVYKKILLLPYSYFYNHKTGDIIARISDLNHIKNTINKLTLSVLLDGLILLVGSIILYNISSLLFRILIINIVLYIILLLIFKPFLNKYTKSIQENNSKLNNFLVESISSFETVKGLSVENVMSHSLEKITINDINVTSAYDKIIIIEMFIKDIIYAFCFILIMYIGTKEIMSGRLLLSDFILFNTLMVYFFDPIKNVIDINKDYHYFINSIKRINSLFIAKSINLNSDDNLIVNGNIKISNLVFGFNNNKNIIDDISLEIFNNDKVLVIGPSGSGKSTFLKLLIKYYEVKRSMIFINGIDICDFSYATIKNNISYISQNEILYTDTIKNNIMLQRNIDEDKFLEICKICKVDQIVENLFLGYDTLLEENAHNLSGGQRQRIILARTLINDSKILLIDEGLNQVDVNLERRILKSLFKLDKTIIVVSHRIDNMDLYDKVIKIKNGKLEAYLKRERNIYE